MSLHTTLYPRRGQRWGNSGLHRSHLKALQQPVYLLFILLVDIKFSYLLTICSYECDQRLPLSFINCFLQSMLIGPGEVEVNLRIVRTLHGDILSRKSVLPCIYSLLNLSLCEIHFTKQLMIITTKRLALNSITNCLPCLIFCSLF